MSDLVLLLIKNTLIYKLSGITWIAVYVLMETFPIEMNIYFVTYNRVLSKHLMYIGE